jgi:hypothetical protein
MVDDRSRLAYSEILPDEKGAPEGGTEQDEAAGHHPPHPDRDRHDRHVLVLAARDQVRREDALSAMASQMPATATAAGSIRPVRWSRWTSSVLFVTTSVAAIRSPSPPNALASTTPGRAPLCPW